MKQFATQIKLKEMIHLPVRDFEVKWQLAARSGSWKCFGWGGGGKGGEEGEEEEQLLSHPKKKKLGEQIYLSAPPKILRQALHGGRSANHQFSLQV